LTAAVDFTGRYQVAPCLDEALVQNWANPVASWSYHWDAGVDFSLGATMKE
jgi:hypothetical protein